MAGFAASVKFVPKVKRAAAPATNFDLAQTVMNRLRTERVRCVDVETSGLDWKRNHIVGYVLAFSGDPRDSYYLPVRHAAGGNVNGEYGPQTATGWDGTPTPYERALVKELDKQDTVVFGHNIGFDLKFLWQVGMTNLDARFEDTMVNAPLINEWQPTFSLEGCCNLAGVQAKKSKEIKDYIRERFPEATDKDAMGHYWRLAGNDPTAVEYAVGDGTSTWQLRDAQTARLQQVDIDPITEDAVPTLERVWDVESRLIPYLARMSCVGIKIDVGRLHQLIETVETKIETLKDEFPSGFNPRSNNDVKAWMERNGVTNWPTTPTGLPSFRKDWLDKSGAGKKITDVRKFETLLSSFLLPMRDVHLFDGRVHTTYNQLRGDEYGTVTGRLSCSDPNLQAVSKHDEEIGRLHRSMFVPDDGMIWASADYSQIEPKLLAFYSRCKALIAGYTANPPVDAHWTASMMANGARWERMSKEERKAYRDNIGKRINQTIITGGGPNVLVEKYGMKLPAAKQVFVDYFKGMPEIKLLQNRATSMMQRRNYVRSLLDRRARLRNSSKAYTAVNRLLQCGNADVIKLKMVECCDYLKSEGWPVDMLNNIHDDLAFQFPEEHRKHYERCLEIMVDFGPNSAIPLDVPITVDAGEGANWAEATYDK